MKETLWRIAAYIVSRRPVAQYLISRAQRTPYSRSWAARTIGCIWTAGGFNPYLKDAAGQQLPARWGWLPSIRVHHHRAPG